MFSDLPGLKGPSMMSNIVLASIFLILGILIGNHQGDQKTFKDCASTGRATMAGGGDITCDIVKDSRDPN